MGDSQAGQDHRSLQSRRPSLRPEAPHGRRRTWSFRLAADAPGKENSRPLWKFPPLAAVQEVRTSPVPTLRYGVAYAVGNVQPALWGTLVVVFAAATNDSIPGGARPGFSDYRPVGGMVCVPIGSRMTMVVPPAGGQSMVIWPLCASISRLTVGRPRPEPRVF